MALTETDPANATDFATTALQGAQMHDAEPAHAADPLRRASPACAGH
jgi:hypothetical protein